MKQDGTPINVMLVVAGLHIGGAERVVANLCRYSDPARIRASVCWLKSSGKIGDELRREGYDVAGVAPPRYLATEYLSFLGLRDQVKAKRIQILHSHGTSALMDAAACRVTTPKLRHVHTFHFGNYPHLPTKHRLMERFASRIPDSLIAVGNEQRKTIQATHGLADDRISTIYNGVEEIRGDPDDRVMRPYLKRGRPIIGSISTLIEQKGITFLLDVARILKEKGTPCVFVVVGDGPLRGELEEKCRRLGLYATVFFLGWVENAAIRALPFFHVFFQPSLWEAMSMVLLEALAAGVPVVATDVGENRHIVDDGEFGYIVPPGDVGGLAESLEKLVVGDGKRTEFGRRARSVFAEKYTAGIMADNYATLYASVLHRK
jgi:glycosyltransferase involved in cell wall biosynthesis